MKILFICTGNSCRSPMAQGFCRELAKKYCLDISCDSAGFFPDNTSASVNAIECMKGYNIDISKHIPKMVCTDMVNKADVIVTMTSSHISQLCALFNCEKPVYSLDVPDPYGQSVLQYAECAKEIYTKVKRLIICLNTSIVLCSKEQIAGLCDIENERFSTPWSAAAFAESFDNEDFFCFGAVTGNKISGYGAFYKALDEAQITNIAVLKAYEGCGIAKALVKRVIAKSVSLNLNKIFLEVRASNEIAINLYKSIGFVCLTTRKGFYDNAKDDAFIMSYDISDKKGEKNE